MVISRVPCIAARSEAGSGAGVCVCVYMRVHGCAPGLLGVPVVGWIHLVGLGVQV